MGIMVYSLFLWVNPGFISSTVEQGLGVYRSTAVIWVVLLSRVPFRSPIHYGTLIKKNPKRDPNFEN